MENIESIFSALRRGQMIVLIDSEDRENEGDLILAAEKVTPAKIAFMARFGRGLICVPLTLERVKQLRLDPMTNKNTSPYQCQFTVSVDAKKGVTTGISAYDRACTIRALIDKKTKPGDLVQPGHVFPLVGHPGGVLERAGHTEGALDLLMFANLQPAAVICEIMGDHGQMLKRSQLRNFAKSHHLPLFSIAQLRDYRRKIQPLVKRVAKAQLPTAYGKFLIIIYKTSLDDKEHLALVMGKLLQEKSVLVRIHSECLTGDIFHSLRCDCQRQLDQGLKAIAEEGSGVFLYLRHEGRGIGLINKIKAYGWQDKGLDTVEANEKLGFQGDERDYSVARAILRDLGIARIRLMTNNPQKMAALKGNDFSSLERVPLEVIPHGIHEKRYLRVKKIKLGHILEKV